MQLSPRSRPRRCRVFTRPRVALAGALALSLVGHAARAQTTYNFSGPASTTVGGSLWSNSANWTAATGSGTTYPSTTLDQANLNDTTANRIVTYDGNGAFPTGTAASGSSGLLGALNITETSGFNNEVVFIGSQSASTGSNSSGAFAINTLQVNNNITLAASGAGSQSTLFINGYGDPNSSANQANGLGGRQLNLRLGSGGASTLTINSGGVLEMLAGAYAVAGGNAVVGINGNVLINSGGVFNSDRSVFAGTAGASQNQINGSITMVAGGVLNLSAANSLSLALNASPATDNRTYATTLQIQGGTINQQTGGTSTAASTTLNGSSFYVTGSATSYIVNATFNTGTYMEIISGGSQTFLSNVTMNNIISRNNGTQGTQAAPVYALKTIGAATVNGTTVTANGAGTLNMGQLQFGDTLAYTSSSFQLASNVTIKSGSLLPNRQNPNVATFNTLNVAGFTFDMTGASTAAAGTTPTIANGLIWSPTTQNNTTATAYGSTNVTSAGTINITSSVAGGVVKAAGFDFSGGGTASAVNVTNLATDNATVQTNSVTLQSTGGPATANNLNSSGGTGALAISPTSTFLYSGTGTQASPATLTATNRTIGMLAVSAGFLQVNPGGAAPLTTGGAVSVTGGGLDISGTSYGALTLNAGNFSMSNATLVLTLGGSFDTISATAGAGQSFSLSNVIIALNGANSGTTYQVFNNFSGTNTVSNVTFSNVPAGETASLSTAGVITFATAVPEPGTWVGGVLLVAALGAWGRRRRLQATRSH